MEAGKGRGATKVKEKRWEDAELQTELLDCYGCQRLGKIDGRGSVEKAGSGSCDRGGWNHRAGTAM